MRPPFMPEDALLSHRNNLLQKCRLSQDRDHQALCQEIDRKYTAYLAALVPERIAVGDLGAAVAAVGSYLDFAKEVEATFSRFNWRSDFAASILPEFIYRTLGIALTARGFPPLFSTRDSIVEVSLSGTAGGGWDVRRKNQDLCIGLRREKIVRQNGEELFLVPLIAMEVKTNIDINKLNGLDYSAERLKRTFPASKYILVTETIDFSLDQNYASGSIDEIYTLRKQVRSQARREKKPLEVDVFTQLQSDVVEIVRRASFTMGHVYDRLEIGKLISVE
ncbi:Bpu10I family restriction endonuclease [Azohydromonas lata]|uniref:Bpu10I family restriction endonuclease n=1 Tax=Azohydromonas lata TaxID=45677 RepID=A0ABU5IGA5_9BURK|nr:Bpu10I family restriction endonuclease [Azohydromonas lata]MDZ5458017.1 Bpu10I family restriction endonuclease [Azohydromonas lata]